jgi:hypothetical protein
VENNTGLNRFWYPGGAAVYMRRFSRSALVELPGTPKGTIQPLIMVQELGSISADIVISREMPKGLMPDSGARLLQGSPGAAAIMEPVGSLAVDGSSGPVFVLDAIIRPWQYSRRLPLRKQWLVYTDDGWLPLEKGRYELPREKELWPAHLRFRLEIRTPDGELEYRAEKAIEVSAESAEEDSV